MAFQIYYQIVRRSVLTPNSATMFGVPAACSAVVFAASNSQNEDAKSRVLIKPSELPLYDPANDVKAPQKVEEEASAVVGYIGVARQEVWKLKGIFSELTGQAYSTFVDAQGQVNDGIDYIRKEERFPEQIAFIAAGGLTGFLFAIRRGFFKKLLYLTLGSAGAAAVVYPDQASFYFETGVEHSQRTGTILYHFLNGLARDYAGFDLPALSDLPFTTKKSESESTGKDAAQDFSLSSFLIAKYLPVLSNFQLPRNNSERQ